LRKIYFFEVLAGGLLVVAVILKRQLIIVVVAADVPAMKCGSITPAISSLQSGRELHFDPKVLRNPYSDANRYALSSGTSN
jgi:hypothetical protein